MKKLSAVSFWSNNKHLHFGNSWNLRGKKISHNDLLLRMESLMTCNSNHDANNNDKSWSDYGLEIESNGLWMKETRWFIAFWGTQVLFASVYFLGLYRNIREKWQMLPLSCCYWKLFFLYSEWSAWVVAQSKQILSVKL